MSDINLEDGKILYDGKWLSIDDLTQNIVEKMQCGDMKIADMAAALEKLSTAIEHSCPLQVRIVLSKDEYEKLRALGGGDDKTCIRRAVQAFIDSLDRTDINRTREIQPAEKKMQSVLCSKCNTKIHIPEDKRPAVIECPFCGTTNILESDTRDNRENEPAGDSGSEIKETVEPRHKDHFIG